MGKLKDQFILLSECWLCLHVGTSALVKPHCSYSKRDERQEWAERAFRNHQMAKTEQVLCLAVSEDQ